VAEERGRGSMIQMYSPKEMKKRKGKDAMSNLVGTWLQKQKGFRNKKKPK
jgi:hypothetical protein